MALGVKVAQPERSVVAISGDGGFLYNSQELATAVKYGINVVTVVFNDNAYGNVLRDRQTRFEGRTLGAELHNPDFVKLAEAYGCVGIRANKPDELDEKIAQMLSVNKPVIFDCVVDKTENCYPMIPSGKPHNQMLLGKQDEKEDEISEEGKVLV